MLKNSVRAAAAAVAVFLAAPGPAQAAAPGTVDISGVVPQNCIVSVTAQDNVAGTGNLDLTTATADTVATVNEKCNSKNGFTVDMTSTNGGSLVGSTSGESIAYTIEYAPVVGTDPAGMAAGTSLIETGASATRTDKTGGTGSDYTLKVTAQAPAGAAADTYADTITITLTAN